MLALPVVLERFKMVSGRHSKILEYYGPVQLRKLSQCGAFDVDPTSNASPLKKRSGVFALAALDRHTRILTRRVNNAKRRGERLSVLCGSRMSKWRKHCRAVDDNDLGRLKACSGRVQAAFRAAKA